MILPFKRDRLSARNVLDELQMRVDAASCSPSERVERTLALSQTVRDLAQATGADRVTDEHADLTEKARLYVEPLRAVHRGR